MEAIRCKWSDWSGLPAMDQVYATVKKTRIEQTITPMKEGDAAGALKDAAKPLKATYEYPVQTHGSIGPSCSIADVRRDRALIWSASQSTHWTQRQIAKMLGMKPEQVRIIYLEGAGCYGRNGHEDATADAVVLSQAIGRPVRVQWMRQDEHGWDPKAPPYVADLEGALDAAGNVVAWNFVTWLPFRIGGAVDVPLLAQDLVQGDVAIQTSDNMNPGTMESDAKPPYTFPNVLSTVHKVATHALSTVLAAQPGAHAEHVRQRMLHGRAGSGGRRGPGDLSPEAPQGRPRLGMHPDLRQGRQLADTSVTQQGRRQPAMWSPDAASPTCSMTTRELTFPRYAKSR